MTTSNPITEGPLGFPMTDQAAQDLETLMKGLPKDCTYRKSVTVSEDVQLVAGERADISLVSFESIDKDREVVLAKGMILDRFRENPIVTFAHRYDELPVGKCKWIKLVQRGVLAKTQYARRPDNWEGPWLPDACFSLTQEGILKGKSVGFLPTMIRSPTKEEINQNPSWKSCSALIESCVLFEYAIAPIPCNWDSLALAVSKGFDLDPKIAEKMGLTWPVGKPKENKDYRINTKALVKALDGISFDPDAIENQILQRIRSRGKV